MRAGAGLEIGPGWVQSVKPAVTRARTAAWQRRRTHAKSAHGLRILFYHRVSDDPDVLAVSPGRFAEHMALLDAEGYDVLDVVTAARRLAGGACVDGVIALCFDDGYLDVAGNALPVLERHGMRASVFVATGVTDGRARFGWYRCQPAVLAWPEVVALDRGSALRFEAHTVTHPNLLLLDDESARYEIVESKRGLEERLGRAVDAFCYPAGLFGERERTYVADAGYRVAVSCEPGVNRPDTDALALRRRQIDPRDRRLDFRAKVGGGHDTPLPLRGLYRRLRYGEGAEAQPTTTALSAGR
jgi:peptidoglycan/xylan/chitin deacetylase (PgdA/CDA1 family)